MPSTRKLKAKARRSREMDKLSDYGNMDVKLGKIQTQMKQIL